MVNGGLTMEEINNKLIFLGFDGVVVFIGVNNGVTMQINHQKGSPFYACCPLCCTLDKPTCVNTFMQPLVHKLEGLFQATYTYFSNRHLEQCNLAQLLEIKGNKLLCNVKTRWIFMLSHAKRVLAKYKSLMLKMNGDLATIETSRPTLEFLCDVKVVLGLMCIMPMLEVVYDDLIKFA
jgi:hypothetical protein